MSQSDVRKIFSVVVLRWAQKQYGVLWWFKFVMLNMNMTYRTKLPTDSQIVVATDATL